MLVFPAFENIEEDVALNTNIPQSSLHAVETVIETTTTAVSEQGNGLLFSTARAESIKLTDDVTQVQNEVPGAAFLQSEPSRSLEPATVEEINQEDTVIEQEEQRVQGPQRRKKKSKASPFATRKTPPRQAPTESEKGSSSRNAKSRQKNTGTRQKSKEFIEQRQLSSEMDAKKSPSLPQDEKENEPPEEEASEQLVTKSLGIVDESTHISPNDQGSQEPSPEPARQSRRGRRGKRERSQHAVEEQSENLEPAQGIEEQPENAHVERTETTKGSEAQHKRKRRKHALSRNDEGNAGSRDTQKRTIPVTVHRLSNVAALETAQFEDLDIPGHEDLASQKQSQKYLNRSGINAADVLSQICSESLDKTISTLQNNIEQEQNASRRNEWKRKCKVVEEFKSELENSLFDTSELMESNFTLAARLKAEKRELHQLRHRLLTLRKEREETALRIDEVRRKHLENENERMVCPRSLHFCSTYVYVFG